MRNGIRRRLLFVLASAAALCATDVAAQEGAICPWGRHSILDKPLKRVVDASVRYPSREARELGEGWVLFRYKIDREGVPRDFQIINAIGPQAYGTAAIEGFSQARYEPPTIGGQAVEFFGTSIDLVFRIEGENRAGVHMKFESNYTKSARLRKEGKYQEALDVLKENLNLSLNLYEFATTSYALAFTYTQLKDRRRALRHIRHAAIQNGSFADKGVREASLKMLAELEALDNNFVEALCAHKTLMERYPSHVLSADLARLLERARRELSAATPLVSDVELIETGRSDLPTKWSHRMLRRVAHLRPADGARLSKFEVWCPTVFITQPITRDVEIRLDESAGVCELGVYGEPGARFSVEER